LKEYGLPDCLRITVGLEVHCRRVFGALSGLRRDDKKTEIA
jgi:histidinol-phosphate/aromatic aminotransferase/cobyric acid decarboxylase-like protein